MPVQFDSPQPFDAQAAANYGAFQRQQADRDFALRQQQLAAQREAVGYQTAIGAAQADNQAREAGQAQDERAREFDLQRQPSPLDVFQARQQQQQVEQRFELQAWLQGQELSQAEKVHLERQQNALGELAKMKDTLTPDEYYDALAQLRTGIDFGRQRLERAQQQRFEQQAKLEQQQVQLRALHAQTNDDFRAQALKRGQNVAYFYDENSGKSHPLVWSEKDQKYYNPLTNSAKDSGGAGKPFDIAKAQKGALAEADLAIHPDVPLKDKDGNPTGKWARSDDNYRDMRAYATKVYERERDAHRQAPGAGGSDQAPAPDQGGNQPGPTSAPPPGGGTPEPPEQRQKRVVQLASRFQDQAARVEARPDLPPEKRGEYAAAFRRLQALAAAFGSPAEMPERYRKEAEKLASFLATLPDAPRPGPGNFKVESGFQ